MELRHIETQLEALLEPLAAASLSPGLLDGLLRCNRSLAHLMSAAVPTVPLSEIPCPSGPLLRSEPPLFFSEALQKTRQLSADVTHCFVDQLLESPGASFCPDLHRLSLALLRLLLPVSGVRLLLRNTSFLPFHFPLSPPSQTQSAVLIRALEGLHSELPEDQSLLRLGDDLRPVLPFLFESLQSDEDLFSLHCSLPESTRYIETQAFVVLVTPASLRLFLLHLSRQPFFGQIWRALGPLLLKLYCDVARHTLAPPTFLKRGFQVRRVLAAFGVSLFQSQLVLHSEARLFLLPRSVVLPSSVAGHFWAQIPLLGSTWTLAFCATTPTASHPSVESAEQTTASRAFCGFLEELNREIRASSRGGWPPAFSLWIEIDSSLRLLRAEEGTARSGSQVWDAHANSADALHGRVDPRLAEMVEKAVDDKLGEDSWEFASSFLFGKAKVRVERLETRGGTFPPQTATFGVLVWPRTEPADGTIRRIALDWGEDEGEPEA